jgi:hypothetical protein
MYPQHARSTMRRLLAIVLLVTLVGMLRSRRRFLAVDSVEQEDASGCLQCTAAFTSSQHYDSGRERTRSKGRALHALHNRAGQAQGGVSLVDRSSVPS